MPQTTGVTENADKPLLRLNDREWFNRLGQVAKSIGSREFHHELVDLFGASIRHELCWMIRFSRATTPQVLFTHNVADDVVSTYSHSYSASIPSRIFGRTGAAPASSCSRKPSLPRCGRKPTAALPANANISERDERFPADSGK